MLKNKISYFQGTEEPKPKSQQYKPEKAELVQPRFKEPFYKNYDLYNMPGEHSPGAGYHELMKEKSVKDFINKKRKKIKNKYISEKSKNRKKKIKARINLLSKLTKFGIDFPIDDMIGSGPILGDSGSYSDSIPIGGQLDKYLPEKDFSGKSPHELNFGRDYSESSVAPYLYDLDKILSTKEPDLLFPNGFDPEEDLDADKTIFDQNPDYGKTDSGNTVYNNMWFV